MAYRIPARADGVPERQARRPGPPGHFVPGATSHMLDWFKLPARRGSISYMKSGIKPNRPPLRRRRSCRRYRCCSASPSVVTKPLEHDRMTEAYRGLVDERASLPSPSSSPAKLPAKKV
jgi:hypothetical protein